MASAATIETPAEQLVLREDVEFWWVWTKRGRFPARFHWSEEAAFVEAQRLARKSPTSKFIVLRAYAKFGTPLARSEPNPSPSIADQGGKL